MKKIKRNSIHNFLINLLEEKGPIPKNLKKIFHNIDIQITHTQILQVFLALLVEQKVNSILNLMRKIRAQMNLDTSKDW